ncbi:MAG: alkaline phosphatase family protein [Cyanobacteriota bacterium]|nr:alkaline phosphatase family protein [Cyanobacteriota bacterium]
MPSPSPPQPPSRKVILVVCDGLRNDTAAEQMGYLEHLVEQQQARRSVVQAQLPTKSRPLYETLITGLPPAVHGITHNQVVRGSQQPHLFGLAQKAGKTTAAVAFFWFSELYNHAPFRPILDREVDDPHLPIQHGRFYVSNDYPDPEVFVSAATLIARHQPDFLLVHPMGVDYWGHRFGSDSEPYRNQVLIQDEQLATYLPDWLEQGYVVLVTADHGMNPDRMHGGTLPLVRHVPLYLLGLSRQERESASLPPTIEQCQIAPTICQWLGLGIPPSMTVPPFLPIHHPLG